MALDISFLDASDGTGDAALMTITANRIVGSTVIQVDTLVGVPAKFIGTSGTLDAQGFIVPASITNFYGHINGSDLAIDGFCSGNTDAGNTIGQIITIKPNTDWANLVANAIQGIKDLLYPVGSIYMNTDVTTNPATLLGFGTWTLTAQGRALMGRSTSDSDFDLGDTGGSKTHAHLMFTTGNPNQGDWYATGGQQIQAGGGQNSNTGIYANSFTDPGFLGAGATINTGSTNGLPPYLAVCIWKRTA